MNRLYIRILLFAAICGCASAQWINYPDRSIPRTHEGKPNLRRKREGPAALARQMIGFSSRLRFQSQGIGASPSASYAHLLGGVWYVQVVGALHP